MIVKWLGLLITLAAILPLSAWLRRNPRHAPKVWLLLGLLPFSPFHLYMAFISWPQWPGFVQGTEFWVIDAVALVLFLSLRGVKCSLPFQLSMYLYFAAVLLSILQARTPIPSFFYPWQLVRIFLMYAAVTRGVYADPRVAPALLKGMATGLIIEATIAVWQRFGLGVLQVNGTFEAQNSLGFISHFFVYPFFAIFLSGAGGLLSAAVTVAGTIIEMLTASRATLGIAISCFGALFFISAIRKWNSRKVTILAFATLLIPIVVYVGLSSIGERATGNSTTEFDRDRDLFLRAAAMILSDHPMGIGSNQYLVVVNSGGYEAAADVPPNSRDSIVHNVYWLVLTETGYLGLITFVFFLLQPLAAAFLCGWRNRGDQRGDLLLGLGFALLAVYVHCYFEWIFVRPEPQYMFAQDLGLVAGLAQQLGYWRPYRGLVLRQDGRGRSGGARRVI